MVRCTRLQTCHGPFDAQPAAGQAALICTRASSCLSHLLVPLWTIPLWTKRPAGDEIAETGSDHWLRHGRPCSPRHESIPTLSSLTMLEVTLIPSTSVRMGHSRCSPTSSMTCVSTASPTSDLRLLLLPCRRSFSAPRVSNHADRCLRLLSVWLSVSPSSCDDLTGGLSACHSVP